ncbi:uncharacterized protein LOC131303122 [Rhododendron vialii]|uniref:uncharacterized protein LOC131303122 n=1 Tax=Rhododendron vialii TaxID=182163 RepID=UPI00265FABF2|nr:uncharacterized protein LOC131303122 [Rhododendron vialii]
MLGLFKYVSVEEFLEAYARLPIGKVEDFYSLMRQNGIQVDTEVTTCLLKSPLARMIPRCTRDKWIKANCDAGFEEVEGREVICVGAIVFTCPNGKVKGYRRVQFYDVHCPSFAEFRGFELAIDESILRKYNKVLIEMDSNNVVNALRGGLTFPTKRWDDYRNLPLKSMKDYEICHIPRKGNELADLLVRIAKFEVKKLLLDKRLGP